MHWQVLRQAADSSACLPACLPPQVALPFNAKLPQQQAGSAQRPSKAPVVHQLSSGGHSSAFITRGPDEIPSTYSINLLEKLQQAIGELLRCAWPRQPV